MGKGAELGSGGIVYIVRLYNQYLGWVWWCSEFYMKEIQVQERDMLLTTSLMSACVVRKGK